MQFGWIPYSETTSKDRENWPLTGRLAITPNIQSLLEKENTDTNM